MENISEVVEVKEEKKETKKRRTAEEILNDNIVKQKNKVDDLKKKYDEAIEELNKLEDEKMKNLIIKMKEKYTQEQLEELLK